jgi:hypothetical protein
MKKSGGMFCVAPAILNATPELLTGYGCGPIEFTWTENAFYERHSFSSTRRLTRRRHVPPDKFEVFARSVRDILDHGRAALA